MGQLKLRQLTHTVSYFYAMQGNEISELYVTWYLNTLCLQHIAI